MSAHPIEESLRRHMTERFRWGKSFYGNTRLEQLGMIAERTGIERTKLGRWFRGQRTLTFAEGLRLAEYVGFDVSKATTTPAPRPRRKGAWGAALRRP